jgi:hypothetical protein
MAGEDAGIEAIEVAAVDERASDLATDEVVERFLSYEDKEGEWERSLAESLCKKLRL